MLITSITFISTEPLEIKYAQIENDSMATSCNENLLERRKHLISSVTSPVTGEEELLYDASTTQRLVKTSQPSRMQGESLPIIYFVTPTYPRREQIAELTRLGQTLMHIPNLHWIVADDNPTCNNYLDNLLIQFGEFIYCFRKEILKINILIFMIKIAMIQYDKVFY